MSVLISTEKTTQPFSLVERKRDLIKWERQSIDDNKKHLQFFRELYSRTDEAENRSLIVQIGEGLRQEILASKKLIRDIALAFDSDQLRRLV